MGVSKVLVLYVYIDEKQFLKLFLKSYKFKVKGFATVGAFFCIVRWAGLPFVVMGPSILSNGVKTSPALAQLGLACAQTMPRLPGVCIWQAKLFKRSYGRQT